MSRIHEALKKAQEERAAHQSERDPAVQESAAEGTISASTSSAPPQSPTAVLVAPDLPVNGHADQNGGPLTFESLLARSRQRNWNPDPAMLLFAGGASSDFGAR